MHAYRLPSNDSRAFLPQTSCFVSCCASALLLLAQLTAATQQQLTASWVMKKRSRSICHAVCAHRLMMISVDQCPEAGQAKEECAQPTKAFASISVLESARTPCVSTAWNGTANVWAPLSVIITASHHHLRCQTLHHLPLPALPSLLLLLRRLHPPRLVRRHRPYPPARRSSASQSRSPRHTG